MKWKDYPFILQKKFDKLGMNAKKEYKYFIDKMKALIHKTNEKETHIWKSLSKCPVG